MKNPLRILVVLFTLMLMLPLILFAQDTPPLPIGAEESPTLPALPTTVQSYWMYIVAVLTPLIMTGITKLVPKLPKWLIPISTPLVGIALGGVLDALTKLEASWIDYAQLGMLASFIRESWNQVVTKNLKPAAAKVGGAAAAILLCGCLGATSMVGCTTVQQSRIENRAKGVSFTVSAQLLKNNPTWRDGFVQASADLKFIADQEVVDLTTLMAIINRLPKLQSGDAAIYIQGAIIIFADELNTLALQNPAELRLASKGLYEGIDLALGFIVPKASKAPEIPK